MGLLRRASDHKWSQQHLSHYIEGDLGRRARRRLDRHAQGCAECGRGILAMRALVHMIRRLDDLEGARAPAGIFDRVRAHGPGGSRGDASSAPPQNA